MNHRECGECTRCCEGWELTDVAEHIGFVGVGLPCRFVDLGKGCTIYEDRPTVCRHYKCEWLKDDMHNIPDWLKPNESNIIITEKPWGEGRNIDFYWSASECGETIRGDVLHWLIVHCEEEGICLEYMVAGEKHYRGVNEFHQWADTRIKVKNV